MRGPGHADQAGSKPDLIKWLLTIPGIPADWPQISKDNHSLKIGE